MNIPKLNSSNRSREYNAYSQEERDKVIYNYLFNGLTHRKLDEEILGIDSSNIIGFSSMNILHYLGMKNDFKGLFKKTSIKDAIHILSLEGDEYRPIIESLQRSLKNQSNGIFDSWQIINNIVAIKTTDKSVFEHHGSGIPKNTRGFWGINSLSEGERYSIQIIYKDVKYDAYFQRESNEPYRTRLFWHSNLQEEIKKAFPNYKEYESNKESYPLIRFEKLNEDSYKINFIVYEYVNEDIKSESEETTQSNSAAGNKEGKATYYYSKKYERNPKNRIEAIKIHGTKCVCCGFDFEKVYGERGSGFVEIHHNKPLYSLDEEIVINPKTDLVPVCSNCHRIIHRKKDDVLTVEEVSLLISNTKRK